MSIQADVYRTPRGRPNSMLEMLTRNKMPCLLSVRCYMARVFTRYESARHRPGRKPVGPAGGNHHRAALHLRAIQHAGIALPHNISEHPAD
ncbi:hypothetical protein ACIDI_6c00110 [Acidiphilium sp. JA12-A1]|nr:hypothetical protein ACIDI_6c00110 [Acidiphilium sp. JA12-A1]